jgi:hypothetical protein
VFRLPGLLILYAEDFPIAVAWLKGQDSPALKHKLIARVGITTPSSLNPVDVSTRTARKMREE